MPGGRGYDYGCNITDVESFDSDLDSAGPSSGHFEASVDSSVDYDSDLSNSDSDTEITHLTNLAGA